MSYVSPDPLQTFLAQHITFLASKQPLTPGAIFGSVITHQRVVMGD